jgi:hypothetical protein
MVSVPHSEDILVRLEHLYGISEHLYDISEPFKAVSRL